MSRTCHTASGNSLSRDEKHDKDLYAHGENRERVERTAFQVIAMDSNHAYQGSPVYNVKLDKVGHPTRGYTMETSQFVIY
jgi:hypothetical protein